jgi:chromosomal replication initiator protein
LQSRLSSGLTVPIEPPGADARLEILRRWTSQRALRLSESILQLLAQELSGAVPELIGAMLQLEVTAVSDVAAIDRKRVKEFLSARKTALQPKASDVAMATARHFKLKLADMRGPSRRRGVVVAREVAMYLCRQLTNLSLQSIGHYFGDRDHTTVMHACRKTTELLQTDPAIREAVEVLEAKLSKV